MKRLVKIMALAWTLMSGAGPDEILVVKYQEKYGGQREEKAMAVFEDGQRYRLIHPDYDKIDLMKENIVSIQIKKERAE